MVSIYLIPRFYFVCMDALVTVNGSRGYVIMALSTSWSRSILNIGLLNKGWAAYKFEYVMNHSLLTAARETCVYIRILNRSLLFPLFSIYRSINVSGILA